MRDEWIDSLHEIPYERGIFLTKFSHTPLKIKIKFSLGCPGVTSVDLRPDPLHDQRLMRLRHADLSDCACVDDVAVATLAAAAPNLQNLYLRRCSRITGRFGAITSHVLVFHEN